MSLLDTIKSIFRGKPELPKAPRPPEESRRIYLRGDRLVWRDMADVKAALGDRVTYLGNTVNLKGAVISGKNLPHPKDKQNEGSPGVQIIIPGFTLINGWVDDSPGGLIVKRRNCGFRSLTFINIGEDALSTVGDDAMDLKASNCDFWNAGGDKSIQLNQAYGAILFGCRIVGGITGIRVQKDSYKTKDVNCSIRDFLFEGMETGMNVAGGATVRLGSPTFKNVRKKWVLGKGCRVVEN